MEHDKEITDKSEIDGICTNQCVLTQYTKNLFDYIIKNYKQKFNDNLTIPFGFSPDKRMKLIHGYDVFNDINNDEFITLPFTIPEEVYLEFE